MGRSMMILTAILVLVGCQLKQDRIVERDTAVVLERNMTINEDFFAGTKRHCQILLELNKDSKRISLRGRGIDGAAPYNVCQYILKGERVDVVRYEKLGWYLVY